MPNAWLLKTEPGDYSWNDLVRDGETEWDGVRAPAALKNISRMRRGDRAFIYHTGRERAILGLALVATDPYPDPEGNDPRHLVIKVAADRALARPVTLAQIKASGKFSDWDLVRLPRLSVVPVDREQAEQVMRWGEGGRQD